LASVEYEKIITLSNSGVSCGMGMQ